MARPQSLMEMLALAAQKRWGLRWMLVRARMERWEEMASRDLVRELVVLVRRMEGRTRSGWQMTGQTRVVVTPKMAWDWALTRMGARLVVMAWVGLARSWGFAVSREALWLTKARLWCIALR
jgi:hypothetical protein